MCYNGLAIRGGFGDSQSDIVIACYQLAFLVNYPFYYPDKTDKETCRNENSDNGTS